MLIGLAGKKRAGKNTVASLLPKLTMLPVFEVAFADKMKESICNTLGITLDELEEWKESNECVIRIGPDTDHGMTMREFLQSFGTEGHREVFGYDFWVDQTLPATMIHQGLLVVVTDVRFENEAQRIVALGGENWFVFDDRGMSFEDHVSERGLDPGLIDEFIDNRDRDLDLLSERVERALHRLRA